MTAIDREVLLDIWDTSTKRDKQTFDQIILSVPDLDVVPKDTIRCAIHEMEAIGDAECRISGPTKTQWVEKCIDVLQKLCL